VNADETSESPFSDEELTALALAADPDAPADPDAVPLSALSVTEDQRLLPQWYMPSPMGPAHPLRGWRRRVILVVIASFVLINAYGLCSTYGHVGFG
jgi:hypothetical protein